MSDSERTEPYEQQFVDLPVPPNRRGVAYRLGLHVYPSPGPNAPAVVIWPALGTPARFYRPLAQALQEAGVAMIVVDLRGTGSSTPTPTRADRYRYADLVGDVETVAGALKPHLDGRRYYLLGHSLGGQLCTLHLAGSPARQPDGLILVAVGLPYWRDYTSWSWPRRLGVLGFTQTITAIATIGGIWPGWGFGGRASGTLIRDWGYTARHGRFPRLNGLVPDPGRVRGPVLAISTPLDEYTPAETLDRLCDQLTGAQVERVRLTEPLDHFSWVRQPAAVAAEVARFVAP